MGPNATPTGMAARLRAGRAAPSSDRGLATVAARGQRQTRGKGAPEAVLEQLTTESDPRRRLELAASIAGKFGSHVGMTYGTEVLDIPIGKIEVRPQVREVGRGAEGDPVDMLSVGLAASVAEVGVIDPITVERVEGKFVLIAGERRLNAARRVAQPTVRAIVANPPTPLDRLTVQMSENLHRKSLNLAERAVGYQRMLDLCDGDKRVVARRLGITIRTIDRTLQGHAEVLARARNPQDRTAESGAGIAMRAKRTSVNQVVGIVDHWVTSAPQRLDGQQRERLATALETLATRLRQQ